MMSVNISEIGNLAPVEPLNLDDYADVKSNSRSMPESGRYTLRAPESFPATAFTAAKSSGALMAQIDPTIVGPTNDGYTVRFTKVSGKQYDRDGKRVSQIGDYLRSCGVSGNLSDAQATVDAVCQTANLTYEAQLDWELTHRASGFKVKGMRNFPKGSDGRYIPFLEHPSEKDEAGNPLRLRANVVITRFYPKTDG